MRLVDCFTDSLSRLLRALETIRAGGQPEYEELRLGIENSLAEHAGDCIAGGYSREQYEAAKFPVVALIDEALLQSTWQHRERWAKELLQRSHFNTSSAGTDFFRRLDALSPFNPAERDIREVFFYCLALGFVGQFYHDGDRARLDDLRQANYRLLNDGPHRIENLKTCTLFPAAIGAGPRGQTRLHQRWTALYYGLPLLVLLAMFVVFRSEILGAAERLITVI